MALSDKARATIAAALANTASKSDGTAAGGAAAAAGSASATAGQPSAAAATRHGSLFPAPSSQPAAEVRYVNGKKLYICNCETCRQMRAQKRLACQQRDADLGV